MVNEFAGFVPDFLDDGFPIAEAMHAPLGERA
jgi:hypothetical protein